MKEPSLTARLARDAEVERVAFRCREWAEQNPTVKAVAIVGSFASGLARADSDLDLLILTSDPSALLNNRTWAGVAFGQVDFVVAREWGAITEARFRRPGGLEIDVGIGRPHWAMTDPLDEGTAMVVADGCRPIHDPQRMLAILVDAVQAAGTMGHRQRSKPFPQTQEHQASAVANDRGPTS